MLFFSVEAEKSQILQTKGTVEKGALNGGGRSLHRQQSHGEKTLYKKMENSECQKGEKKASLFLKAGFFFFFKLLKNFPLLT